MKKTVLLTGCAGFIGSNFLKTITLRPEVKKEYNFVIVDALTYAGHYPTIETEIKNNHHLSFECLDLRHEEKVQELFKKYSFDGVIHFAAESHVDRSIKNPNIFIETNVLGTLNLLNESLKKFVTGNDFRFVHISTDEVYGTLKDDEATFTEEHPIKPNSPYSASKASSDLVVRSFFETYGFPAMITRCSNNYGPYQFPEKFIPLMVQRAKSGEKLPIYGEGKNIRDWIFVDDHNEGVWKVFTKGRAGEVYNLGGGCERRNLDVAKTILQYFNLSEDHLSFVTDRLGHDYRYGICYEKTARELDWAPSVSFEEGLKKTIEWYLNNEDWMESVKHRKEVVDRKDATVYF